MSDVIISEGVGLRVLQVRGQEITGPYPGLRPFQEYERAMFYGRDRQVQEIIERLRKTHFVAVLGASASGKSSVVHAGVVPELRSFAIEDKGDSWLPITFTPGTTPEKDNGPLDRFADSFIQQALGRLRVTNYTISVSTSNYSSEGTDFISS